MFKILLSVLGSVLFLPAVASDIMCGDVGRGEVHPPINFYDVTACFVFVETAADKEGQLSRDPDGIAVYSVYKSEKPKLVYEFPYAGTEGKINDVFFLPVNGKSEDVLFVIHSMETPKSWDPVSDVYDVSAMRLQDGGFVQDEKLSRFFGMGGDLLDKKGGVKDVYPYKDKKSVEEVVQSPLFSAVNSSALISGVIKESAFLYGGETEASWQDPKKSYLVKGDQVVVKDSVAGWCKIYYNSKKTKPVTMWVQCKSITFDRS